MAAGGVAAFNIFDFQGNDLAAVQRQNPVDRARETQRVIGPAHRFSERNRQHEIFENVRQQILGGLSGNGFTRAEIFALFGCDGFQLRNVHALSPGKTDGRFRRLTVFIKRGFFGRSQFFNGLVFLLCRQIGDIKNQTARGRQALDAVEGDAFIRKRFADNLFHIHHRFG